MAAQLLQNSWVSYLHYTPDVRPPPADPTFRPPSHAGRWAIGTALYLVIVALWTWWMTIPPTLEPPLAIIPLPDGTELRLVHVARGAELRLDRQETFEGRIYPSDERYRGPTVLNATPNSKWLVFTHFDPKAERCSNPQIEGLWVVEENPRFNHRVFTHPNSQNLGNTFQPLFAEVAPLRAATWRMQVNYRGDMIQASIPNPFPASAVTEFAPKPLPQKVTLEDGTVELTGLKPGKGSKGSVSGLPSAMPQIKITMGDLRESAFNVSYELFDAAGNVTDMGVLPFGEPAWGLRVRAVQRQASALTAWQRVVLAEVPVPGPGEMAALKVPPYLTTEGVTDIFLVGPGNYNFRAKTVTSTAVGGKPRTLPFNNHLHFFSQSVNGVCVLLLCEPSSADGDNVRQGSFPVKVQRAGEAIFHLSYGEKSLTLNSSGSSTSSGSGVGSNFAVLTRHFSLPKNPEATPETKLRVEYVDPKILEATFYFPTPDVAIFK